MSKSEASLFLITPVKMCGYTTAPSYSARHIRNRYQV